MNTQTQLSYLDAERIALDYAYLTFFGANNPVGVAFTFIRDRKNGNEWTEKEKEVAKYISRTAISDIKYRTLYNMALNGSIRECAMLRRFMSTGKGTTDQGYNY